MLQLCNTTVTFHVAVHLNSERIINNRLNQKHVLLIKPNIAITITITNNKTL
ncbi:hypothetical protein Hanom_Chr01g00079721 [Helianthus anomalus]